MLGNNAIARIFEHCGLMTDLGLIHNVLLTKETVWKPILSKARVTLNKISVYSRFICNRLPALCIKHYKLSIMNYALSIMNYALSIINYALWIMHYELCIMNYALWIMHYALCIMNYALCIMHYELPPAVPWIADIHQWPPYDCKQE